MGYKEWIHIYGRSWAHTREDRIQSSVRLCPVNLQELQKEKDAEKNYIRLKIYFAKNKIP